MSIFGQLWQIIKVAFIVGAILYALTTMFTLDQAEALVTGLWDGFQKLYSGIGDNV